MDNLLDNLLVEVRFVADDSRQSPGRLTGTLVKYGERARHLAERFADGALAWAENGLIINQQHNREMIITRVFPYVENRELRIDAALPNTQAGRDAATNVREGILTGLSVGFIRASVKDSIVDGIREIRYAMLDHGALVDDAEYGGSTVEVRHSEGGVALPRAATLWL